MVRYAGIVTLRQQPDTANGVIFMSLEDETVVVQVIVWKSLREKQRPEVLLSRLLSVYEAWQREGEVMSPIAGRLEDLSHLLGCPQAAARTRNQFVTRWLSRFPNSWCSCLTATPFTPYSLEQLILSREERACERYVSLAMQPRETSLPISRCSLASPPKLARRASNEKQPTARSL